MSPLVVCFMILLFIFPTLIHTKRTPDENSNSSRIMANCIEVERQILISFKQGLEDPTGKLSSWSGRDCCKWSGVGCSKRTGRITKLDLRGSWDALPFSVLGLKGKLNPSLFELKYLHYLDLSCNDFESSTIPSSIGSLRRLIYLNLSLINFSGMVPPHLGNLSNLLYLDLHASYDNGGIISFLIDPSILWVADLSWLSGLSLLKYLNLGSVNLSLASNHWLQAVSTLSSIEELHFPGCKLHDLPRSPSVSNFTSLSVLNLEKNYFNASLPSWLLNITTLTQLRLQDAGIKDSFDNMITSKHLCNLQSLDLSLNGMSGEIVRFVDRLSKCSNVSIEELRIWGNKLQGQLPESLGQLRNLRHLDLSLNMISGFVPASIGNLSHLTLLSMGNNELQGKLPETIGQLEGLAELYLESNNWVGAISEIHFLHLKNLKWFGLSSKNKSLAFEVSPNWVPSFSLMSIEMSDCQMDPKYFPFWLKTQTQLSRVTFENIGIIGEIPSWFWELISPRLTYLILSNNQLSGKLPKSLMFAPNATMVYLSCNKFEGLLPTFLHVKDLDVRNNSFSGQIPATIGSQMSGLSDLDLSENYLTGDIPTSSLVKLTKLISLSLSSNNLTGEIPQLESLQTLSTLDLSNNHLVGKIPQLLCSLPRLQQLILNNNSLSGNIAILRNCTSLYDLRLADNHFTGNIPRWIGETMPRLSILSVRGNSFTGIIPETLCQLPYLHLLELGDNNLSGVIPSCVGNLEGLRFVGNPAFARYLNTEHMMDLNTKGRTLTYTWAVVIVNSIDLSRNHLEGEIPEGLTTLTRLGTLNLSHNQLTGTLPEKIGNLTLLETLDFSSNNLSGPIPTSITNLTSLSHLNLSYNNLSGQIPSANQFLTLNDPSIYEGNLYLCGTPLPRKCSTSSTGTDKKDPQGSDETEEEDKVLDMLWFDIGLTSGVAVGFWIVCGSLAINKSWRHQVYHFLDKAGDRMYVVIALKLARWLA